MTSVFINKINRLWQGWLFNTRAPIVFGWDRNRRMRHDTRHALYYHPATSAPVTMNLLSEVQRATAHARSTGALRPLASEHVDLPEAGIDFRVHWLSSLALKDAAKLLNPDPGMKEVNPFLPYEHDLFVADLSATHVALLNKFPLFENHILMVTRSFEEQRSVLTGADFDAIAKTLAGLDGLVFFNGGRVGGASQPHKHLQWVPPGTFSIEPVLPKFASSGEVGRLAVFPFRHAFVQLPSASQPALIDAFRSCCRTCGLAAVDGMLPPYNLLVARGWLLLVPRSVEHWIGGDGEVSMNAMSFAGSLFVRRPEQIEAVRRAGPMALLKAVTYPA